MQTIVLVEDDRDLRDLLICVLADAFPLCTVHAAATGRAFLELFWRQTPDLVLLDLRLPDTSGIFLYKAIGLKTDRKDVPALFVTAEPERVYQAQLGGSYACIAKPFDIRELVAMVAMLLSRSGTTSKMSA